jgi:protein ImuB
VTPTGPPSLFAPASRRILCVRLRNWPIDRLCRRRDALRDDPLALVATVGNRRFVAAASGRARSLGVRPGIDQAEAMAVCPSLTCLPHDPAADARGLRSLGRWMMRFTPVVGVANGPDDPLGTPDALVLDVTGCERVFHGLGELARQVVAALERFRLDARVALGPNPGAAWAMTFTPDSLSPEKKGERGANEKCKTCNEKRVNEESGVTRPHILHFSLPVFHFSFLPHIPCGALRLDDDGTVAKLYHLGIRTIGQLLSVPREQLPARFGPKLTLRLDQLLGDAPEPLVPLDLPAVVSAGMDFDGVVTSAEALWAVFRELLGRVITQLERRGRGARELDVTFTRAYAPPLCETVRLSRPSRDPVNLFNLFRCATERMDGGGNPTDEFLGMRLLVRVHEPLGDEQVGLLDGENYAGEMELDRLIERLCARLGERSVTQAEVVESHVPERATRRRLARARPRSRPGSPKRTGRAKGDANKTDPSERHAPLNARPLHLFTRPLEVAVTVSPPFSDEFGQPIQFALDGVHRLAHVAGPERIGGQWWDAATRTRDYFDVEDESGRRFWLFRVNETRRWYLHGEYA